MWFFGFFFFSRLVLSACVFYKACNLFLFKIFWSLFVFFLNISLFWNHSFSSRFWVHFRYFLVHLIVWKLLQGSLEIIVLFCFIFDLCIFPSKFLEWVLLFWLFFWKVWICFCFLFDCCESVIFVYMILASNCLKTAIVKSCWHKKHWIKSIFIFKQKDTFSWLVFGY